MKTHVYSVIMNVRQEGVEEDWPLELIDFDGEWEHRVGKFRGRPVTAGGRNFEVDRLPRRWKHRVLKPGQLLFYQSAKLIHGRPSPFNGSLRDAARNARAAAPPRPERARRGAAKTGTRAPRRRRDENARAAAPSRPERTRRDPAATPPRRYANCFCHFAPKVGWDFEKREGDVLYYKGEPLVDYKIRETYDAPELVSAK